MESMGTDICAFGLHLVKPFLGICYFFPDRATEFKFAVDSVYLLSSAVEDLDPKPILFDLAIIRPTG